MKVRKITNISTNNVGVTLTGGNVIYLKPQESISNIEIDTYNNIAESVIVEYDLSEVPVNEGRTKING